MLEKPYWRFACSSWSISVKSLEGKKSKGYFSLLIRQAQKDGLNCELHNYMVYNSWDLKILDLRVLKCLDHDNGFGSTICTLKIYRSKQHAMFNPSILCYHFVLLTVWRTEVDFFFLRHCKWCKTTLMVWVFHLSGLSLTLERKISLQIFLEVAKAYLLILLPLLVKFHWLTTSLEYIWTSKWLLPASL